MTADERHKKIVMSFSKAEYGSIKALEGYYRELLNSDHAQKEELQKKIQSFVYDHLQKKISKLIPELGNEIREVLSRYKVNPVQPLWVQWGFVNACMTYITEYRLQDLKEYVLRMYRYR